MKTALNPRSVFYTQSVVRSPQSMSHTDCVNACSVGVRGNVLLLPKLGQLLSSRTRLSFMGEQLQGGHFYFRNIETEHMLVYQSNILWELNFS